MPAVNESVKLNTLHPRTIFYAVDNGECGRSPHMLLLQDGSFETSYGMLGVVNLDTGALLELEDDCEVLPFRTQVSERPNKSEPMDLLTATRPDALTPFRTHIRDCLLIKQILERRMPQYDPDSIYIERQSFHPDDWYLYTVIAKKRPVEPLVTPALSQPEDTYAIWTVNLTSMDLCHGHYDLKGRDLIPTLLKKRPS